MQTIPSPLTGSTPRVAPRGLGDTRKRQGWKQPSRRDPTPHLLAGGSGDRRPRPVPQRGRRIGREAGAERSAAAGWTLPPSRLAQGKAAQMRIRAATFPRAAHMCQVKRGFGSWQHRPTALSGELAQADGFWEVSHGCQPRLCEGPGSPCDSSWGRRKSPAGDPGEARFSRGMQPPLSASSAKKPGSGDISRPKDTATDVLSGSRGIRGLPGRRRRNRSPCR